ncbi:MAG: hypothetical protein HW383_290 [Candidatus Magasanikbacteria bacterium]|nr:hypothetical protein [Candidatus Magasanikbacteria bacterium]
MADPLAQATPGAYQASAENLKTAGNFIFGTEATKLDLATLVGNLIRAALLLLGIIFLGLIVYAGYLWMTAAGQEEKITEAKKTLIRASIGMAIVLGSYAITNFVISGLIEATIK